jgi:hypothetical protein
MTTTRAAAPGPVSGPPKLSLREPTDVLAAIPYLVGFHPTDSLVVLALRGKRLVFAGRADLPPAGSPAHDEIGYLVEVMLRQDATGAIVVGYGPAARVDSIARGLQKALERRDLAVLEVMRAEDGRYWSYLCNDPTCCPTEGSLYNVSNSLVAATATLAGMSALADRCAFENQLEPLDGIGRACMNEATERAHDRLIKLIAEPSDDRGAEGALIRAGRRAVTGALARMADDTRLDDDEVAWLSVLVSTMPVLGMAWRLVKGREDLHLYRSLWMDVFRRAQTDLTSAPGCLLAYAAWRDGDGALASMALERVLTANPFHEPSVGLSEEIASGTPPSTVDLTSDARIRPRRDGRPRTRSSSLRAGSRRG